MGSPWPILDVTQHTTWGQLTGHHISVYVTAVEVLSLTQSPCLCLCRYIVLLKQKDAMEAVESTLQKERESVREEIHKNALILGENQSLRGELDR